MSIALQLMLLGLGAFGLLLSLYMTSVFIRVERGQDVRCLDGACPVVMKTSDARTFGFPNFYLAVPFYLLVVLFAGLRLAGLAAWIFPPVAIASALSFAMSLYLAYSLIVRLKRP